MSGAPPRIGYSTFRDNPTGPGDRRRFLAFAAKRDLAWEIARPDVPYDLVIANPGGDLSVWSRLPKRTKFVFDMVDSYLAEPGWNPKTIFRGVFKYAMGHTRHLHLDYRALIEATCRRADAVICSTEEQRESILALCPEVHVILDFQSEATGEVKSDYTRREVFQLVWEGLPQNVSTFREFAEPFRALAAKRPLVLNLITDVRYPLASTHFGMRPTTDLVREVLGSEHVTIRPWNLEQFAAIATSCDLAVIPIPLDIPFMRGKPENKLVLFWRLGLPVVTSATPAYERAMRAAGLAMTCRTPADWTSQLERLMDDEAARREAGQRGLACARETYSEASTLAKWDAVVQPLIGKMAPMG